MVTTVRTEPTEQNGEDQLEAARSAVHDWEAALARLPKEYATASKRADAAAMREIRHRRVDAEEALVAAKVRLCRSELAQLTRAAAEVRNREAGIAADIERTQAALVAAHLAFDQAERARSIAENAASGLRWELQHVREQIIAAQDRLGVLTSQPMPD